MPRTIQSGAWFQAHQIPGETAAVAPSDSARCGNRLRRQPTRGRPIFLQGAMKTTIPARNTCKVRRRAGTGQR
ncbi:hypothetical protein CENSYa_0713 [Cenarchaeum symbiosum A]|uniref:Uncharacterized protein n=1 Tax=Cenarchaeum symbiosum (strain A) TaxID=414004 RepID=A0RVH9_CENSY|nr:hypothetical protein CENSYa_0713 [Cenarchaeum symbiosum A]